MAPPPSGPDRITKAIYDAADQVTKVQSALGTADQADEVSAVYTDNGQVYHMTDGEGNTTGFGYDGFDRLNATAFPLPAKGSLFWNTGDQENLTYDAAGNVVSKRLRDGQTIAFSYDNLNRLTLKNLPNAAFAEYDVSYAYDNLGRLTSAPDASGRYASFTYDALGRVTGERSVMGLKAMAYDLAGRMTRLTYADGFFVDYDYLTTGEVAKIRENGATSGIGVLAAFGYDDLGRRTSLTRGNGTVTSYAYDPASRLASLAHDIGGTAGDLTLTFGYNPASQIITNTRSNDAYAWTGHGSGTTASTLNGLNQLATQGGTAIAHDGRGNLTNDGTRTFGYTAENKLATSPSANFYHDTMGRLFYSTAVPVRFDFVGTAMVAEHDGGDILIRRYVWGPGVDEPLVWYEGGGTSDRRFLHADERGSIVAVSDSAGTATAINKYDEYGKPQGTLSGRFGYTGQAWLPEIQVHYYKTRMMDPKLGRFLQNDKLGYVAGMNLYAYVRNDPVNFVDPFGLREFCHNVDTTTGRGNLIIVQSRRVCVQWPDFGFRELGGNPSDGSFGLPGPKTKPKPEPKSPQEKRLPRCLQNFLNGRIKSNPADIILHEGSPFDLTGNSVTFGNDIYLVGDTFGRTDRSAIVHKFHEIQHTSQYARGYSALNQAFAYVAFGGHDASPFEQAADDFATNAYDAYKAAGLDKTCKF